MSNEPQTKDPKPFDKTQSKPTMADLMANINVKSLKLEPGDQVEGEVITINDSEIVLDLGGKAEGVIGKKEFGANKLEQLKAGDSLQAFVIGESNFGQVNLTLHKEVLRSRGDGKRGFRPEQIKKWQRLANAKTQKTLVTGKILETNKGGLLVDIDSLRGFLPISQVSLKDLGESENGLQGLIGKELKLYIIEIDMSNNKLILSTREEVSREAKESLNKYQAGQQVQGKIVAITPFGLLLDLNGLEGVVYSQETSWAPNHSPHSGSGLDDENLLDEFSVGQEIKAKVVGKDENLGRLNLSIRQLQEDPFEETASQFQVDDVVTGTVIEANSNGSIIQLEDGVEGFIPTSKIESGTEYQIGQKANFLVDNVDMGKRRVNLAPFLTSTKGLIYK